jgi:short-subunit dehydrogenase
MNLKGKLAVVVGASGGIGREITLSLAREGTNIIMVARNKGVLRALEREVSGLGVKTKIFTADLSRPKSAAKTADKIAKKHKTIDILFNAAGVGVYNFLEKIDLCDWERSLDINVTAPFIFTQRLISSLSRAKQAVVISLGSGMGKIGLSGRSAYCTSKFALRGLMLSLAKEYKNTNVQITHATLGSVLTSFGPLSLADKKEKMEQGKKYLEPGQVAHTLVSKIANDTLEDEVPIYPSDYFAESRKDKR